MSLSQGNSSGSGDYRQERILFQWVCQTCLLLGKSSWCRWGATPMSKGPVGPPGVKGLKGTKGDRGPVGPEGAKGDQGAWQMGPAQADGHSLKRVKTGFCWQETLVKRDHPEKSAQCRIWDLVAESQVSLLLLVNSHSDEDGCFLFHIWSRDVFQTNQELYTLWLRKPEPEGLASVSTVLSLWMNRICTCAIHERYPDASDCSLNFSTCIAL